MQNFQSVSHDLSEIILVILCSVIIGAQLMVLISIIIQTFFSFFRKQLNFSRLL